MCEFGSQIKKDNSFRGPHWGPLVLGNYQIYTYIHKHIHIYIYICIYTHHMWTCVWIHAPLSPMVRDMEDGLT